MSDDLQRDKILEMANKLGIKYKINSKNPGIFMKAEDGRRKIDIADLFDLNREWCIRCNEYIQYKNNLCLECHKEKEHDFNEQL